MEVPTPTAITHLLVPLDGSPLAEAVLPAALVLAERFRARVTLLHVIERQAPVTVHGHPHLTTEREAEAYLAGVAARFAGAEGPVARHVHPNPEGDVAASIAAHAAELAADLVVLCAHGQGGARGWLAGTIAQQVIRRAAPPVLLVRPDAGAFAPAAILVALDGSPEGEAVVPVALAFARALGVGLTLVAAVATVGTVPGDRAAVAQLVPAATAAALDLEEEATAAYLARLAERLRAAGFAARTETGRGDPARTVAEMAARAGPNLLALATHGRAGFDALWAGSVGSRLVARLPGPLLLVHP